MVNKGGYIYILTNTNNTVLYRCNQRFEKKS